MPENKQPIRIHRKEAVGMDKLVSIYIKQMKLAAGLNTQRIYDAWDNCSGAGPYTLKRYFRAGKLYVTLSSSMVRTQLSFQKDLLLEKINAVLREDPLFTEDNHSVSYVKEIVLK